jgi:hypothetical protein
MLVIFQLHDELVLYLGYAGSILEQKGMLVIFQLHHELLQGILHYRHSMNKRKG